MPPAITVAIPYHENPGYLAEAIASVKAQTLPPAELLLVDNSGNDEALLLLENLPFPVRRITCAGGLGLATLFNLCLDECRSEYCNILHYDDVLAPHYLATMADALLRHPQVAGAICRTYATNAAGRRSFSFKDWCKSYLWPQQADEAIISGEPSLRALLRANFIMCPTMCFRLPALAGMRFDARWHYLLDLDFFGRLLMAGHSLLGLRAIMYGCRRHPTATTTINEKNFRMLTEGPRCIQHLSELAAAKGWHMAARTGRRKTIYHAYVAFRVLRNLRARNIVETIRFIVSYAKEHL